MRKRDFWNFLNVMCDCIDCEDCIITKYSKQNRDFEIKCSEGCGSALNQLFSQLKQ